MRSDDHHARGGATVAVLNRLSGWEANLLVNLRLWCTGPDGQAQVWNEYARTFGGRAGRQNMQAFETLISTLIEFAHRPLVRHGVNCACVGADESIFLNLVKTASDGHLNDAALIATLIAGPAQAETIAMLAGEVGTDARQMTESLHQTDTETNVVRIH